MREGTRNFMVGLMSIIALLSLALLLFLFGELDRFFNPRYPLTLVSDNAAGLRPGSSVEFSGVPVGVVDTVTAGTDPKYPVRVVALIDEGHDIPSNVEPLAATALIGGAARLQLQVPNDVTPAAPFLKDGSAMIVGPIRSGLFEQVATQLDERLKPIIDTFESFGRLTNTYNSVGENINALLQPQSAQQLQNGDPPNLHTAVTRLNRTLDDAHEALALVQKWLGDEALQADVRSAAANVNAVVERAGAAMDRFSKLAETLDEGATELLKGLLPATDELAATLEDVRLVMKSAMEGRGTVAQLLNSPDLYNSLTDAAMRLERTLIEAQLLIQQLRAEGFRFGL